MEENVDLTPLTENSSSPCEQNPESREVPTTGDGEERHPSLQEPQSISGDELSSSPQECLERITDKLDRGILPEKKEMDRLAALVYQHPSQEEEPACSEQKNEQTDEAKGESTISEPDLLKIKYINIQTRYKELKAKQQQEIKETMEQNLVRKNGLIERMTALLTSTEDFGKIRQEFKRIRQEWKEIGDIPQNEKSQVLKRYQEEMEKFYEINAITNEFREYDFAKNKEEKERLIELARGLTQESDVINAFKSLQHLHDEWRETGPVAPQDREQMWTQFKELSTVINKKHQDHFIAIREEEKENLAKKTTLCERMENLLCEIPDTRETWRKRMEEVELLKEEWRTIGFAPKKYNAEIYQRFRKSLNEMYTLRRAFMKEAKGEVEEKLEKMRKLVAEAESLADSTDWKKTAEKIVLLQQEWKQIGGLGTRVGEATRLWKKFSESCNAFFKAKHADFKERGAQRNDNLKAKREIVDKLLALKDASEDITDDLEVLKQRWQEIGYVPQKYKDEINDAYYQTLRELQPRIRKGTAQHTSFVGDLASYTDSQMTDEYLKVGRIIARVEEEIKQYENNLGFFQPVGAGSDNPLAAQVKKKIERLRGDLERFRNRQQEIRKKMDEK